MTKQIAAVAGAGAMLLSLASPAFAHTRPPMPHMPTLSSVTSLSINSTSGSSANSGYNSISNGAYSSMTMGKMVSNEVEKIGNTIGTGIASAVSRSNVVVGSVGCNVCSSRMNTTFTAGINSTSNANSNSGYNSIGNVATLTGMASWMSNNEVSGVGSLISTGAAGAESSSVVIVGGNYTVN